MSEVTRILCAIDQDDPSAADRLLPLVYEELRKLASRRLAQEKPGQTLEATALVHEAYLRLVDVEQAQRWNSRGHFFAAAAAALIRRASSLEPGARRSAAPQHYRTCPRRALASGPAHGYLEGHARCHKSPRGPGPR